MSGFFSRVLRLSVLAPNFFIYTLRRFYLDNCFQIVSALTFTSLLALVPLMTIGFAILAAFPAFDTIQQEAKTIIFSNLVPTVGDAILTYLDRFTRNAGKMTGFGLAGLAVTSVMLLATIESAFNGIWKAREPRPVILRLLAFWTILTLGPLLFGVSLSLSGSLSGLLKTAELSPLAEGFGHIFPYISLALEVMGFAALYIVIPNRAVEWRDAFAGAAVATLLFELSKRGFGWYMEAFPAYQTIYGALALIPIFLLWLYVAWSTVLFGAVVAAAFPEWRSGQLTEAGPEGLLPSQRFVVAMAIIGELYQACHSGVGMRRATLLVRVPVGGAILDDTLNDLSQNRWINRSYQDTWFLARDLSEATLYDLEKSLGIGLRTHVRGLNAIQAGWQSDVLKTLQTTEDVLKERGNMPLRSFLERG